MVNSNSGFKIKYDRNTIDHLGIKLYSAFPPVLAELISNAYDADAENVKIRIDYNNKTVVISDDGEGMNHEELNNRYLVIGRNRRIQDNGLSSVKNRKVTGKKGLGKLATFGIANEIEVSSVKDGKENSFVLNYEDLKNSEEDEYVPKTLLEDNPTDKSSGTSIKISQIKQKNIMQLKDLAVSLSKRFSFNDNDFNIVLENINDGQSIPLTKELYIESIVKEFEWIFPQDFQKDIEKYNELRRLNDLGVEGRIYTKATPMHKNDLGFLIYVRSKLASENTFFDSRSNDNFYSYVAGYFNIDYIDEDVYNDFISTARQSILWEESDKTELLRNDLKKLISIIALDWREKRKTKKESELELDDSFFIGLTELEKSEIKKIKNILLADEYSDPTSIKRILESVKTSFKFESFKEYISKLEDNNELTAENIEKIADDWEYIESKELAKVAVGRIQAIEQFEKFINNDESESKIIQPFLEKFPWLLDPRITTFEREVTFKKILKENFPDEKLSVNDRRIDFLCNLVNGELIIIELKRPRIKISQKEVDQALAYKEFIQDHYGTSVTKITTYLISNRYDMSRTVKTIVESLENNGVLYIKSYSDLLTDAKQFNQEFIKKYHEVKEAHE